MAEIYSADDLSAGIWIIRRGLPDLIRAGEALQSLDQGLLNAHQAVRRLGGGTETWAGVVQTAADSQDDSYIDAAAGHGFRAYRSVRDRIGAAACYARLVRDAALKLQISDFHGCPIIHDVVSGLAASQSSFLTQGLVKPAAVVISITVDPFTEYLRSEPPYQQLSDAEKQALENPLRRFHPNEAIPPASWDNQRLTVQMRSLSEIAAYLRDIQEVVADRTNLPLGRPHVDGGTNLRRNLQWFYRRRCENTSLMTLYRDLLGTPQQVDESTIRDGIKQTERLLRNPQLKPT